MADYREFPTTPTGWQEAQAQDWQAVTALETEDPPPPRRIDRPALVPGVFFVTLALVFMAGLDLPVGLFAGGGILWLVLIGAGVTLLVRELRTARRRR